MIFYIVWIVFLLVVLFLFSNVMILALNKRVGEPVSSTLHSLSLSLLFESKTFSLSRWQSFADFLELKRIDVCLVRLQVDAKWSLWLASILLNSGNKV